MFFICVVLIGLLQVTVLRGLNLLVALAVFSGLRRGPLAGLLIGGMIGAFAGIFSVSSFELNLVLYAMAGFISGIVKAHIYYKETVLIQFVFSFCGLLLFYLAYFILTNTAQISVVFTALFSAAVSPLLFRVVERQENSSLRSE